MFNPYAAEFVVVIFRHLRLKLLTKNMSLYAKWLSAICIYLIN